MFTPQEVSEKTFPKSSSFSSGYNMASVDEFLDTLTEDYTALYKENAALKAKLKILAEKMEELNSRMSPGFGSAQGGTISSPVGIMPTTGLRMTSTSSTPPAIMAPMAEGVTSV